MKPTMKSLPGNPSPIQTFILRVLKKRGMSRYELGRLCGWGPSAIYEKLNRPTLHKNIEKMLAALETNVMEFQGGSEAEIGIHLSMRKGQHSIRSRRW